MEGVTLDPELAEFLLGDFLARRVLAPIESGAHVQTVTVSRVSDEVDDHFVRRSISSFAGP